MLLRLWASNISKLFQMQLTKNLSGFLDALADLIMKYKLISPHAMCNDATVHALINLLFMHHGAAPPILFPEALDSMDTAALAEVLHRGLQEPGEACKNYRVTLSLPRQANTYDDFSHYPQYPRTGPEPDLEPEPEPEDGAEALQ